MNSKYLLLFICFLGLSSLAFAGLDITYSEVDENGHPASNRLLSDREYACTFTLYTKENLDDKKGLAAALNVWGPPYEGSIDDLGSLSTTPSYFHNLWRIVYHGAHCNCIVTISQETCGKGKSKNYYTTTWVDSSSETKIDLDWCWASKAESINIACKR